ncbi:PucR family transcriptional regulator [Microbacterium sp.]|uniref:PucR family transcriptional regulator n=1 Tax=Microbacterium sp. TaxID=51671 RepID=UPI0037C62E83
MVASSPPAPTPTLRALLARADLALRLAGEDAQDGAVNSADRQGDTLDRPIRWIHSSDLADPTPFLSEGLALLTTGTQFLDADDAGIYDDYVARLTTRGVVALGFGTEVVREGIPDGLVVACRAYRMPLFEVPYRTPFIAVARANAEAVAAQTFARRSWALAAQRAIALAALRPDGLGATLAELARQLDTWVGLFDATGTLTRQHPSSGLSPDISEGLRDEARRVLRRGARAGSTLRVGGTPFTLQTLGRGGRLRGAIAIAAGDLDQESRSVVTAVIAMAGLALEQSEGAARARRQLRSGVIQSLLAGQPGVAARIAREMWGGLPEAPIVVAVTDAASVRRETVTDRLELLADELKGRLFFGREASGIVLVLSPDDAGELEGLAADLGLRIGVSDPALYDAFAAAAAQARTARDRATVVGVAPFTDLTPGGLLALLTGPDARAAGRAQLEPLLRHDAERRSALVETLRSWLEHDGSHEATARALGIHRHTVRARVATAGGLLDRDLGTFTARAELWAALRALG